jgi:uncharacterized phage protein (TIGR01671 family)
MREIKFRVWDGNKYNSLAKALSRELVYEDEYSLEINFNECTLEQYTGLKDRNGKDIYEGDIVTWYINGHTRTGRVFYDTQAFDLYDDSKECGLICWDFLRGESEVIGNIHENPEDPPPEDLPAIRRRTHR